MDIKPSQGHFVLKKFKEEKKQSILIIPEGKDKQEFYTIVGMPEYCSQFFMGCIVLIKTYSGQVVKYQNEDYMIVEEKDIIACIEAS